MKKILIIQTAFLGDVVLATAAIESIRASDPGIEVSMLVRKGNEGLLKNHPFLHEVLVWNKSENKIRNLFTLLTTIRNKKYDAVINLQRFFASGLITSFSGARIKAGFDKNPLSFLFTHTAPHKIGDGRHEINRNHDIVQKAIDCPVHNPRLYPNDADNEMAKSYKQQPYITMAPASVWFTKQLPEEQWIKLMRIIPQEFKIYLIGGPDDIALATRLITDSGDHRTENLCGKISLLQTASLMRDAAMNFVNDSAPLHIASAMNAPVTAFFCSTIPAFGFGPLSDRSTVLEIGEPLACRPCGLHGKKACPEKHFRCGYDIPVETLYHDPS